MFDIRKALWGSALLVSFVGCANEEPTGENPPPGPAIAPGAPAPVTPAPATTPEKTGEMKKDEPPPAKPEEPKDGPKLEAPAEKAAPKEEGKAEEKKADASPAKETLTSEDLAQIAKLPADDKALAMAQIVCPVSGEHLGSMGAPVKVTAEGKTFLLCCKSCNADVKKNPKEVVAKLNTK